EPRVQTVAQNAFNQQVAKLRAAGKRTQALQGAVVIANPENGELLAVVGGYGTFTGFNRSIDASRQVGSLFKPAIYLTALATGKYNLVSPIDDGPVQVQGQSGDVWSPENYDHQSHGIVPLYDALAHSYNQATIRLGMSQDVGISAVINTLKQLGVTQDLPNYPSLLLGTANLSPMEVLRLYQPFAANGFQSSPRTILEVVDAKGKQLKRNGLEVKQVFDPASLYLINYAMQQTMISGTAASAYQRLPKDLVMAGKTGTTNEARDAWFAGYTGNYLAVVWLGNDDNKTTGLSGGTGALPIWTDIMSKLKPVSLQTVQPESVQWQWLERSTGKLSAEGCADAILVPIIADSVTATSDCALDKSPANDPINAIVNGSVNKVLDIFR
ncbi:MAG TPA: penicillin-binding transpeptidase domain-containing protein, partial [Agitococcus sp.]|nr:penicillin-binding transpeptidase domain-containing protein [Agitococcus sp.]